MSDTYLYTQITSLPKELQKEVLDFIESLKSKTKPNKPLKKRKFGYAKGFFILGDMKTFLKTAGIWKDRNFNVENYIRESRKGNRLNGSDEK